MKGQALTKPVLLMILFAVGGFACGFLTSETKLAPYSTLRGLVDRGRNQPQVRAVHDFLRGRKSDPVFRIDGAWEPISGRDRDITRQDARDRAGPGLRSVGYLSGYEPGHGLAGVTVYAPDLACPGINLITSGHAQEAKLVDMEGHILHTWTYDFDQAFPEYKGIDGRFLLKPFYSQYWRRTYVYPNGDLLAVYEGLGLIKLDRDSRLIWKVEAGCHHDIFVNPDGSVYALGRELSPLPHLDPHGELLEDFLVLLDSGGKIVGELSLVGAFENSSFAALLSRRQPFPDILHTNTIQVLDGRHSGRSSAFREGNVLISARNIDTVAILDPREEKIVWALCGLWKEQHEPTLLDDGNMLVFDNKGWSGMSRVIEIDPLTQETVWAYEGTQENGFFTKACGAAHRLPNGNTLIIESEAGRAFEVTPSNRIVWEYYNPERAGEGDQLIATLFDTVRLPPDFPLDWVNSRDL